MATERPNLDDEFQEADDGVIEDTAILQEIERERRDIPVAAKIAKIDSMSAHADAGEILRWLSGFSRPPSMTYLVHGETTALDALSARIQRERQWPTHVAAYLERVEL